MGVIHSLSFLQLAHSQGALTCAQDLRPGKAGQAALFSKWRGNCQSQGSIGLDCATPLLGDRHL